MGQLNAFVGHSFTEEILIDNDSLSYITLVKDNNYRNFVYRPKYSILKRNY